MIDDKTRPDVNDRSELAKTGQDNPKQGEEQARLGQSGSPPQPAQPPAPGRRPLFRH